VTLKILLDTENLTSDTENLTCDTENLTCDTENLTCDTENLTCDTENLTCDTEILTCDSEIFLLQRNPTCDTKISLVTLKYSLVKPDYDFYNARIHLSNTRRPINQKDCEVLTILVQSVS
jgi:hypothetical protein